MLLSYVSILVVAQSSSEIPEGLMNNSVYNLSFIENLAPRLPKARGTPVYCGTPVENCPSLLLCSSKWLSSLRAELDGPCLIIRDRRSLTFDNAQTSRFKQRRWEELSQIILQIVTNNIPVSSSLGTTFNFGPETDHYDQGLLVVNENTNLMQQS